jgi:hypothetical protein
MACCYFHYMSSIVIRYGNLMIFIWILIAIGIVIYETIKQFIVGKK